MNNLQRALADRMASVQWHGDYFSAICPFPHRGHIESHPSLLVYPDGFNCQGCRRSGTLRRLAAQVGRNSGLPQSIKTNTSILPRWSRWSATYGDLVDIAAAAHRSLKRYPERKLFFKRRGIDQFIEKGRFGYLDGWATFPVIDRRDRVIDIVVRAISGKGDTKYVVRPDPKRTVPNIYVPNWGRVLESDTVYAPYGMIDAWAFEDIGLPAVTGTTGKSLSAAALKPLNKKWVVVPDRYEEDAAFKLADELGWNAEVRRVKYPYDTKDCDEIRMKYGKDELKKYIGV